MSRNQIKFLATVLTVLTILSVLAVSAFALEKMSDLSTIDLNDSSIKKVYFKLATNKDLASYEVNEEMVFTATLWADCDGDGNKDNDVQITSPYFQYTIEYDDGTPKKNEYGKPENGVLTFKTTLTKPGAVRIGLYVSDANQKRITHSKIESKFLGGAIAGWWFARGISSGYDITRWANTCIDAISGLFNRRKRKPRKPKMKVHTTNSRAADYDYNANKKAKSDEVDRILDKLKNQVTAA